MPRAGHLSKEAMSVRACWADPGADEAQGYPVAVLYHRAPPDSGPIPRRTPEVKGILVLCHSGLLNLRWIGYDNDMRLCRCIAFREWHLSESRVSHETMSRKIRELI